MVQFGMNSEHRNGAYSRYVVNTTAQVNICEYIFTEQ